jgi:hypothetical protein
MSDVSSINGKYVNLEVDLNEYRCYITKKIFLNPVIAGDGQTYEEHALKEWFLTRDDSPMSVDDVVNGFAPNIIPKTYYVNQNMKNTVHNLLLQHPELRQWQYGADL